MTSHGIVGLKEGIADVVISNGVFNLCTDKSLAFQSAFDLLKPGGKFLLNDVCVVEENPGALISCTIGDEATSWVTGCVRVDDHVQNLENVGFVNIQFIGHTDFWTSSKTQGSDFLAMKPIENEG